MKAKVFVRLKSEVSDPQGMAICDALKTMRYDGIKGVRVGKVFDLELAETDAAKAKATIEALAKDVLANPIVEEFSFEVDGSAKK